MTSPSSYLVIGHWSLVIGHFQGRSSRGTNGGEGLQGFSAAAAGRRVRRHFPRPPRLTEKGFPGTGFALYSLGTSSRRPGRERRLVCEQKEVTPCGTNAACSP